MAASPAPASGSTSDLRARLQRALGAAYVVERELPGGMSRVFVARDEQLGRDVVVKVLPPDAGATLSAERFKREIALAARLQHPHIVPVLSAGDVDGLPYYTMPFVEGESLRARLDREGELPVAESVSVLREVARALAYAHERGVVHRDIKPDNVMLSGGAALVLDFGVAKAVTSAAEGEARRTSAALTQLGVALGTPAYMAPEQAAADPHVDARADLYAFGCLAYEMLTGQPPFTGRSAQALLAAHVSETPEDVRRRRPRIPASLGALVMQCLEKRPADRPRSADEVLRALDGVAVTPDGTIATTAARRDVRHSAGAVARWAPWAVAAGAVVAAIWLAASRERVPEPTPIRFTIAPPPNARVNAGALAISRDGGTIAFVATTGATQQLWVRPLDQLRARALDGTEGAIAPFFSPDGAWIAFYTAAGELRKVPLNGDPVADVADLPAPLAGGTWTADGTIVLGLQPGFAAENGVRGLVQVPAGGGTIQPLTRPTARGEYHVGPRVFPDGSTLLFERNLPSKGSSQLAIASATTGAFDTLGLTATRVVGALSDRIVYLRDDGTLMATPIDARGRTIAGTPAPMLSGVTGTPALSANGTLVYASTSARTLLVATDSTGREPRTVGEPRAYLTPRLSPDGRRVAVGIAGASATNATPDVWLYDLASGALTRLTSGGGDQPEWMPDGRVLFRRQPAGRPAELWAQPTDGSAPARRVLALRQGGLSDATVSRDGRWLVFRASDIDTRNARDLYVAPLAPDSVAGTPRPFVVDGALKASPRVAPDGRWVAYVSNVSGRSEVYVRAFPGPGNEIQVSTDGGTEPIWSGDGRRLYYRTASAGVVAASVTTAPGFAVTGRAALFADAYLRRPGRGSWDISGSRVVALQAEEPDQINVIVNWATELRAAGTGGR